MPSTATVLPFSTPPPTNPQPTRAESRPDDAAEISSDPATFSQQLTAADEATPQTPEESVVGTDPQVIADLAVLVMSAVLPPPLPVVDPLAALGEPLPAPAAVAVPVNAPTIMALLPDTKTPQEDVENLSIDASPNVMQIPLGDAEDPTAKDATLNKDFADILSTPATPTNAEASVESAENIAVVPIGLLPAEHTDSEQSDSSSVSASAPLTSAAPSAKETAPTQPAKATPEPNPAEKAVANQVVRAVMRHDAEGGRSLVLRLTPPELGTVRIEIIERAGTLTARISSDDESVRTAIERAIPLMRQELRGADAPVRDVTLADTWFGDATRRGRNGSDLRQRRGRDDEPGTFSIDGVTPSVATALPLHQLGGVVASDRVDARA